MTFDEIITGKIDRRAKQIEEDVRAALWRIVNLYSDPTYTDPFPVNATAEVDALVAKLSGGIRFSAEREITQKLLKVFD